MTPEQVVLVQDSFAKVRPIADTAADLFYGRLFEIAPQVRTMFPDDMREQKKKLMAMLGLAVTNLHKPEMVVPALQTLGRQHVSFGTQAAHYEPVGAALLWTLEQGLGPDFTPAVREAWVETYTLVANVMKSAAAEVRRPDPTAHETLFDNTPMPAISTSTVAPLGIGPLPTEVPQAMRSPGSRVMSRESSATSSAGRRIMSARG